jgi:hypothetical protein
METDYFNGVHADSRWYHYIEQKGAI